MPSRCALSRLRVGTQALLSLRLPRVRTYLDTSSLKTPVQSLPKRSGESTRSPSFEGILQVFGSKGAIAMALDARRLGCTATAGWSCALPFPPK